MRSAAPDATLKGFCTGCEGYSANGTPVDESAAKTRVKILCHDSKNHRLHYNSRLAPPLPRQRFADAPSHFFSHAKTNGGDSVQLPSLMWLTSRRCRSSLSNLWIVPVKLLISGYPNHSKSIVVFGAPSVTTKGDAGVRWSVEYRTEKRNGTLTKTILGI